MSKGLSPNLLRSAIFQDIPSEVVEDLCSRGRVVTFRVGEKLFERGQDSNDMMVLQEGVVELLFPVEIMGVTREVALQSKQVGDVVAWSALVSPYHSTLSARCVTECTLTSLERGVLHAFFEQDARTGYLLMRNLAGVIGRRLQTMHTIWMHDLQVSAAKRME